MRGNSGVIEPVYGSGSGPFIKPVGLIFRTILFSQFIFYHQDIF